MEYSKFNINNSKNCKKNTENEIVYRTEYPPAYIRKTYPEKCVSGDSDENTVIECERKNTVSEKVIGIHKISMSGVLCGFLSCVLLLAGIYLSEIEAPEYIRYGILKLIEIENDYFMMTNDKNVSKALGMKTIGEKLFVENVNYDANTEIKYAEENSRFAQSVSEEGDKNSERDSSTIISEVLNEEENLNDVQQKKAVAVAKNMSRGSDKIYCTNRTELNIDVNQLLNNEYPIEKYTGTNDEPLVLIVHTHGTEAYIDSGDNGKTRTNDTGRNVVRVGEELCGALEMYGIPVIHSRTMHDEISYVNAYANSKKEVQEYLLQYPSIKYVIDVHRDAIGTDEEPVKTYTEINGEATAQLMFVMGTNASGGNHPNYLNNLTVAAYIQDNVNKSCPSLMRPVNIRPIIFNQNLRDGCMILEVGSDANTLSEALSAVRMFAGCFARTVME